MEHETDDTKTQALILNTMAELADGMKAQGKMAFIPVERVQEAFLKEYPQATEEQFSAAFDRLPPSAFNKAEGMIRITQDGREIAAANMQKLLDRMKQDMFVKGADGKLELTERGLESVRELTKALRTSLHVELGEAASFEMAKLLNAAERAGSVTQEMPAAMKGKSWATNQLPQGIRFTDKNAKRVLE